MELRIGRTQAGVKAYPMHTHGFYEIMTYIEGEGRLASKTGDYPFSVGTVIIVPAQIEHGSVSKNGFCNIAIGGDFHSFFSFTEPFVFHDAPDGEGVTLAKLIYQNGYRQDEYLQSLVTAYLHYILRRIQPNTTREKTVRAIVSEIKNRFFDSEINLADILRKSGYAEDYARAFFREITGKTPNAFLTDLRVKHACFLIDVYGDAISLAQIAEQCGYTDYVYFSKKFKSVTGVSPQNYKSISRQKIDKNA
jgi:AraC-like DNA-binding protein